MSNPKLKFVKYGIAKPLTITINQSNVKCKHIRQLTQNFERYTIYIGKTALQTSQL